MTKTTSTTTDDVKKPAVLEVDPELAELLALEEESAAAPSESEQLAAVEELELEEAKAEIYAEQDEEASKKAEEVLEKASKAESKKAVEKKPAAKRINTSGMSVADAIKAIAGDDWKKYMTFDANDVRLKPEDFDQRVDSRLRTFESLAKKEKQKVVNAIRWLANGSKLETYTKTAIDLLVQKGSITSDDIRGMYLKHPYSKGTANSQTNQVMHVLPALEVATVSGGMLSLNNDSTIIELMKGA